MLHDPKNGITVGASMHYGWLGDIQHSPRLIFYFLPEDELEEAMGLLRGAVGVYGSYLPRGGG